MSFSRGRAWWRTPKVEVESMLEREIDEGLLDCPKYGVIGELRCRESCECFVSKDDALVQCKHDEGDMEAQ